MAYSISLDKVRDVLERTSTEAEIKPFVKTAEIVVDNYLLGEDIGDGLLSEIGVWLAAHFATVKYRRSGQESTGDVQVRYYAKIGFGFESTEYGQQAVLLDPSGVLEDLSRSKRNAEITWLGDD